MKRGLDLHFGAVIVGVFVDQIGSFAMGAAIAIVAAGPSGKGGPGDGAGNLVQALYEVSCIGFGVAGGYTAARLARRSMVAHGVATSIASLGVSTALGIAMNQEMFDARGIFFALVALAAGPLGGWLASLLIAAGRSRHAGSDRLAGPATPPNTVPCGTAAVAVDSRTAEAASSPRRGSRRRA